MLRLALIFALALVAVLAGSSPASAVTRPPEATLTASMTVDAVPARQWGQTTSLNATVRIEQSCQVRSEGNVTYLCFFVPRIRTVVAADPCDSSNGRSGNWTGFLTGYNDPGPWTFSAQWVEYDSTPGGTRRACLYADETLLAEATFELPAIAPMPEYPRPPALPTAPPRVPPTAPTGSPPLVDRNCTDFQTQPQAQAWLGPGDPHGLDHDRDGIACEELPATVTPPSLSATEARGIALHALAVRYRSKWRQGRGRFVACSVRVSPATLGCRARWTYGRYRYRASVVVQQLGGEYRETIKLTGRTPVKRAAR